MTFLPRIETVGEIKEMIESMKGMKGMLDYAEGLEGPRTRGSTTEKGLDVIPDSRTVELIEHEEVLEECDCYKLYAPELEGRLGAIRFEEAFGEGMLRGKSAVKIRQGDHGMELYIDVDRENAYDPDADGPRSSKLYGHSAEYIFVIIGWHDSPDCSERQPVVYTWHPGEPQRPLRDGITEKTSVKLHNG